MKQLKISQSITARDSETLRIYLNEIRNRQHLTMEEERTLTQTIHRGGEKADAALKQLVEANLLFVVSVAKQYTNQGLPLSDLVSEGNIGLINAAKYFDETRGIKFISYAVWHIRQSIINAINETGRLVRLPQSQTANLRKINKIYNDFVQEYGRRPSDFELAELIEVDEGLMACTLCANTHSKSLDDTMSDDSDTRLSDMLESDNSAADQMLIEESLRIEMLNAMRRLLSQREIVVVCSRFGIGTKRLKNEEIGDMLNLSSERVRQIYRNAMQKLRQDADLKQLLAA